MKTKNLFFIMLLTIAMQVMFVKSTSAQCPHWQWANGGAYGEGIANCIDATGNIYITGSFNSSNTYFGGLPLTAVGSGDIFIIKYSPSGTPLWAVSIGGSSNEKANSICVDANNNVYITGFYSSSTVFFNGVQHISSNSGASDIFIAKYNSTGIFQWVKMQVV